MLFGTTKWSSHFVRDV